MATLREQVSNLATRVAQELNKVREEIGSIEGGGGSFSGDASDVTYENYGYSNVGEALDSLLYTPIAITSFTHNAGTKELGSTVESVNLNWTINKTPVTLTLDGESLDVNLRSTLLTSLAIKSNKSFSLAAIDEKNSTSTKNTTISFLNGTYYGVGTVGADGVTSEFILGLVKNLASGRARTFTTTAGTGEYIYYAYPSRFGEATFLVGGFEGGFDLLTTFSFTNASGYTENYYVYRSTNPGLGETDVVVK